jgi:putative acetyltransferase
MDFNEVKEFRELTRILERNLELLNTSDCCLGNITSAQCHALVEIGRRKDLMLKDLATILHVDVSTTSKVVEELVKKEYVLREPSRLDRRSVQINLTESGFQLFNKIESDMNQIFEQVFMLIEEKERDGLLQALKSYNQAIEKFSGGNV